MGGSKCSTYLLFCSCRTPFGGRLKTTGRLSQRRRSSNFFCRRQLCTVFRLKYRSRFLPLCFSQPLFFFFAPPVPFALPLPLTVHWSAFSRRQEPGCGPGLGLHAHSVSTNRNRSWMSRLTLDQSYVSLQSASFCLIGHRQKPN